MSLAHYSPGAFAGKVATDQGLKDVFFGPGTSARYIKELEEELESLKMASRNSEFNLRKNKMSDDITKITIEDIHELILLLKKKEEELDMAHKEIQRLRALLDGEAHG